MCYDHFVTCSDLDCSNGHKPKKLKENDPKLTKYDLDLNIEGNLANSLMKNVVIFIRSRDSSLLITLQIILIYYQ